MSREGKEEAAGGYAGVEIGLAVLRQLSQHEKKPELAPGEVKTREVFEVLVAPISQLEEGLAGNSRSQAMAHFLKAFGKWRKFALAHRPDIELVAPKIAPNLFQLIDRIDIATDQRWEQVPSVDVVLNDSTFPSLISWLRYDINDWITAHS